MINHLQDCADDYRNLDRVYLPLDWMEEAGARVEDLGRASASPALRRVIDRTLDGVESLLPRARELPRLLKSRRLAFESSVIVVIAERLTRRLRLEDPVAIRVELTAFGFLSSGLGGLARAAL